MINIITENEKLIDELVLVAKLFYTEEEIESLDITFSIEQETIDLDISTTARCSLNAKTYENKGKIVETKFPIRYQKRYAKYAFLSVFRIYFQK